jgi:hypothetical protein
MTEKEAIEEAKNVLVSMFGAVVPALEERDDDPTCDAADDYTIGFATYLMQKRCDEVDRLQSEIKQLEKENKQLKTECTLLDDELRIARQGTIDVLNKLKEKFKGYEAWYYDGIEESYHDLEEEINEFIKELISNDKGKS